MANDHIADDRKKVRLIDANALKEILQEHHDFFVDGVGGFRYLTPKDKARVDEITNCISEVCNAPTMDAVEVCRCKDCKHCKKYRNRLDPMLNHQLCVRMDNYAFGVDEDDFCSYGERKTDEPEEPV